MEEFRDRVSKLEARQDMFGKWVGQIRVDISEIRKTIELLIDKTARLEERVNHLSERISRVESEIKALREHFDKKIDSLNRKIDSTFWKLVILILASTIIPIILRLLKI